MATKSLNEKENEMSKDKTPAAPKAMDDSIKEKAVGTAATNNQRSCYAIKTLVAEVLDLFPETPYEVSEYNGLNVGLDVAFDCSVLDIDDQLVLADLFKVLDTDARVLSTDMAEDQVFVSMRPSPRTYDIREPFSLADALSVLAEDDEAFLTTYVSDDAADIDMDWSTRSTNLSFGGSL